MMFSRRFHLLCAGALMCGTLPQQVWAQAAEAAQVSEEQAAAQRQRQMDELRRSLHPQTGSVTVPGAKATFNLGTDYYFLSAADAKKVLTQGWGNHPDTVDTVLGMIFPAGKQFDDETWGAVIEYEETGHVSDKEAASEDYAAVLSDMKAGEAERNEALKAEGYPASETVGWAQQPTYDSKTKTLIWARNIKFEGAENNTLNYDVRTLGRTGVLSLNMVDTMSSLPQVRLAAAKLAQTAQFNAGARYADFDSSTDAVAEYGLAGLVAAGAGVAVAKKAGLLAILLVFLKKGFVVVIALGAGLVAWIRRRFRRIDEDQEV